MSAPTRTAPRRVVAIGGGHGLSRTLAALCLLDDVHTTAVVAMADDGGSSGRLRRDLGVVPPGDLRKALSSLVADPTTSRWLEHRFGAGELAGHSLGNLMLIGLHQVLGVSWSTPWIGSAPCSGRVAGCFRARPTR